MLAAAAAAHLLRLNKAITLLASNISIPPVMPFILYGALALGHWLFTGRAIHVSPHQMTKARALEFFWQWARRQRGAGVLVAAFGTALTYAVARLRRGKMKFDLYTRTVSLARLRAGENWCWRSTLLIVVVASVVVSSRIDSEEDILDTLPQHDQRWMNTNMPSANSARLTASIWTSASTGTIPTALASGGGRDV